MAQFHTSVSGITGRLLNHGFEMHVLLQRTGRDKNSVRRGGPLLRLDRLRSRRGQAVDTKGTQSRNHISENGVLVCLFTCLLIFVVIIIPIIMAGG